MAAAPRGCGGGGDGVVRAFSACVRFKMRQRREEKRSADGFEAQVYQLTEEYIWTVPRGPCRVYLSVNDEYTRQIYRLTDEYTW
jgi:hypothetical protein